jgi:hypothetical protein
MSNIMNSGLAPHDLGHAIERLRGKWGAIVAFGVLLMALGARFARLRLRLDDRDGDAQRRVLSSSPERPRSASACTRKPGAGSSSG